MTAIEFTVQGDPKPQPRPRAFARDGHARMYDPATAEGWKALVAAAAQPHMNGSALAGPLNIELHFAFKRPKSHYGTGRNAGVLKDTAPELHDHRKRPDIDNLAKAVLDALTTIGMWHDDAQVVRLVLIKRWATFGGCVVYIEESRVDERR